MKDVAPTMQEISDVLHMFETSSFQELQKLGVYNDNRKMVIREQILFLCFNTLRIILNRICQIKEPHQGHYMVKKGAVAEMIHDSKMLWGYDYDKTIPSLCELNNLLKEGEYPRLVEWEPIEIDAEEYEEIVRVLMNIPMSRPYRVC